MASSGGAVASVFCECGTDQSGLLLEVVVESFQVAANQTLKDSMLISELAGVAEEVLTGARRSRVCEGLCTRRDEKECDRTP
jgi:hypothetical protein